MKKRLLSALLALALVFVLLPTTALADTTPVTDENVKINGTAVIVGNDISLGKGNGTYSYDKATHTLTLNSATINATGSNIGISFGVPVKENINYRIELEGKNTITSTSAQAIYVEYDSGLDQQGTQKLSTLTINGSAGSQLILNASGYEKEAIWSKGDFTLSGGTAVTAFSSGKIAVNVGSMTINNSKLSAQSSSYGTTVVLYGLKMIGDTAEFEALNTSSVVSAVLGTSGASENTDWSNYQFTTGSYSGGVLTKSDPEVCSRETLNKYLGLSQKEKSQYIHIAKRTIALETTSDVYIAGGPAVVGQWTTITANSCSGSYYYDAAKKELTLKDVNITRNNNNINHAIQFTKNGDYTINLEGTNNISSVTNGICALSNAFYDNPANISVTITGTGSLNVTANTYAIDMQVGNLIFDNTGNITLTTNTNYQVQTTVRNALHVAGNVTIDKTKYDIEGVKQAQGLPTENIGNSPVFETILKGTDSTLYFKTITIAPKPSKTYYNNKAMGYGETRIVGSGTISCDENGVITLNGVTEGTLEFRSSSDSTLVLEGANTLSSIVTTQKGLTISGSGSGSLTAGSIKVHKEKSTSTTGNTIPNLTINGATVTAGNAEITDRAIDIDGDLTVTNGSLTATSKSDSVPTVQVGGNASFTGSTVTITNNSTKQGKSGENSYEVSTGLYVGGTLDIKNAAKVTSTVIGGNAIYAKGDITISGDSTEVNAQNSAYKFSAISTNRTVNISDNSTVKAENLKKHQGDPTGETDPSTGKTYNACPAITGKIANKNTQNKLHIVGFTTSSAGSQNPTEGTPLNRDIAPSSVEPYIHHYKVTITRGDEVTHTASPVVIAGTTLLNDTYYTIANGSTVAVGTDESNYNAFYDSTTKTLKLNNASINGAGSNKAIEANVGGNTLTIELVGNNIVKTSDFANNVIDITGNLYFTGSGTAEISGKGTPIYATYKIDVSADVTITNTEKAGSFTFSPYGENYKGANTFAIGAGYTAYATTDKTTWAVYDNTTASENENYTTLRITKKNLAPTTPTPQKPFTIYGIPAQFVDGGMIATTGVTATSSNNINLPIDRVKWYTFTPVFGSDGRMDSVSDKTEATGNFEAGKYYVVEIKFVQDLSPFKSWDMKVSGWSDNGVYRQSETARNDIEIYFLTPASAASHQHNWVEKYDTVYHWKMCTYDGCTAIKDKALHVWDAWHTSNNERQHWKSCSECSYSTPPHDIDLAYVSDGEQGHHLYCKHDGCTFATGTASHVYEEGSNICTECGYDKSAPCDHTGDRVYTNNGDGTHKVTCKACGATIVEKQSHEFGPTGACIYCGATQSGGDPTPDNPGTIVIIRPAEEEKPAQQPNPSTGANDLVGMAVAAAVVAVLGSVALLCKHD